MNHLAGKNRITVVVLSALNVEFRAIRSFVTPDRIVRHRAGTHFLLGKVDGSARSVAMAVTGRGNHAAAVFAERAIALFRPDALLSVGIAGALRPELRLGDVVVATRIYAYHGGRAKQFEMASHPRCWEAPHELSQLARFVELEASWRTRAGTMEGQVPRVHFGGIAAGEVVLDSRSCKLADHLRRHYADALAVEMESAGVAHAAHLNKSTPTLTIRAISDAADGTKVASEAAGWRLRAAGIAAAFASALIQRI